MANTVLLNNVDHHDLKVITRHGAEFGDNVATVLTFPTEYADVQREYPIFFQKDAESGEFRSVVLLGFEKNENLFLDSGRWNANYIPAIAARGPFLIGFQHQDTGGTVNRAPVIHIDLDNPRVSRTDGEPIFLANGGNSRYIENIATILNGIRDGLEISKAMFAAFAAMDLIETVNIEIKLDTGIELTLQGLYTIGQERLAALDGDALFKLNSAGFLQGAFLVAASLSNVQKLVALKQRRAPSETAMSS